MKYKLRRNLRIAAQLGLIPNDTTEAAAAATQGIPAPVEATPPAAPQQSSEPSPDILKLKEVVDKERNAREATERELKALRKAFDGVDPEIAKRAKEILAKEEELARKASEAEAQARQQFEPQIAELQKQIELKDRQFKEYTRDLQLRDAYSELDGIKGEFDYVKGVLQTRVRLEKDGTLTVLDDNGTPAFKDGKAWTLRDLIVDMQEKSPGFARHFNAKQARGAGITGSAAGVNAQVASMLEGKSAWEQVEILRANGVKLGN